jgi:hypothetical protein
MLASPCGQAHLYWIMTGDGANIGPHSALADARLVYGNIDQLWSPKWYTEHQDGEQCLLEAAFQTVMSTALVSLSFGVGPDSDAVRTTELLGSFVVRASQLLLEERGGGDLRVYLNAIGTYVLHDLSRTDPDLWGELVAVLHRMDREGYQMTALPTLAALDLDELARELVRKIVTP